MTFANLQQIITDMGGVSTWFWGLFTDLIDLIATNSLLLWTVVFAIVAGSLALIMRVVRKFGVKGRR